MQCLQIHHSRIGFCFVLYIQKAGNATAPPPYTHTHTRLQMHGHIVLSPKVNFRDLPLAAQRISAFEINCYCGCFVF